MSTSANCDLQDDLAQIHTADAARRRHFPIVASRVHLAHAAVAPYPACVTAAIQRYAAQAADVGPFAHLHAAAEQESRQLAAEMLGATREELALAPSTSAGLSMVAQGLPWRDGDAVVICDGDFPANVYPWLRLARRGVQVRRVPLPPEGVLTPELLRPLLDHAVRLVAVSSTHFVTGARCQLEALAELLRPRRVLLCVDAIQTMGAFPLDVTPVDFLVADAHKWLLGPQGVALLYVRRAHFERLEPVLSGWHNVRDPRDYLDVGQDLAQDARRYEPGSINALGVVGLHAALRLLRAHGAEQTAVQVAALRGRALEGARRLGCEVLGAHDPAAASGILSFRSPGCDPRRLVQRLDRAGVVVSLREWPRAEPWVRVSPHFYNSAAEIDQMLELVAESIKRPRLT